MFDALLTGAIVILTGDIADLPMIFSAADILHLDIIHLVRPDMDSLRAAHRSAVNEYDRLGVAGAIKRSDYILNYHMPFNRVLQMADKIIG